MPFNKERDQRNIRSFVRREGRMTASQSNAIDQLFPLYGLSRDLCPFNFESIFQRNSDVILEIGFGMGDTLIEMAQTMPEKNFIGIEVYRPGIGHALKLIHKRALKNLRIINDDAVTALKECVIDHALAKAQIFFPDPWPKKRHHKRRLIQNDFLNLLHLKLQKKGILHIATDWADYAEHIQRVISTNKNFQRLTNSVLQDEKINWRPKTKFETRGIKKGHLIWDLLFESC